MSVCVCVYVCEDTYIHDSLQMTLVWGLVSRGVVPTWRGPEGRLCSWPILRVYCGVRVCTGGSWSGGAVCDEALH